MLLRERIRFLHEDREDEKIGDFARLGLNDDHVVMVIDALKANPANNDTVKVLDLSFNRIGDVGMQLLIGFFAIKSNLAALQKLKVHNNSMGVLGKSMLDGLKMLRKGVVVESTEVVDDKDIYSEDTTPKPKEEGAGAVAASNAVVEKKSETEHKPKLSLVEELDELD